MVSGARSGAAAGDAATTSGLRSGAELDGAAATSGLRSGAGLGSAPTLSDFRPGAGAGGAATTSGLRAGLEAWVATELDLSDAGDGGGVTSWRQGCVQYSTPAATSSSNAPDTQYS